MVAGIGCEQWGILTPAKVLYVYSADMLSVTLYDHAGGMNGDDVVVRLPVASNTVLRPCDPPALAWRLYDAGAGDGRTSEQLGPCPEARRFTEQAVHSASRAVVHIPIPRRRGWLDSLTRGVQCWGDVYLVPAGAPHGRLLHAWQLSRQLMMAGHARPLEGDYAS